MFSSNGRFKIPDDIPEGPSIYSTLQDRALGDARAHLDAIVDDAVKRAAHAIKSDMTELLDRAYIRGARDGFHDGVVAECRRTEEQRKAQPDAG